MGRCLAATATRRDQDVVGSSFMFREASLSRGNGYGEMNQKDSCHISSLSSRQTSQCPTMTPPQIPSSSPTRLSKKKCGSGGQQACNMGDLTPVSQQALRQPYIPDVGALLVQPPQRQLARWRCLYQPPPTLPQATPNHRPCNGLDRIYLAVLDGDQQSAVSAFVEFSKSVAL